MQALKFDIRYPDGRSDELRIDSDRATIGSGAHCEIRLPVGSAEIEHISIQAAPGGLVAEARSFQPPPTLNNAPFTSTMLAPGSILGIGHIQIAVTVMQLAGEADAKKSERSISPMTLVLAALIVPVGMYVIFMDPNAGDEQAAPREIPELFAEAPAGCPQQGAAALAYAEDRWSVALSKRERRPFSVADGVAAVPMFEMASVCFAAAGDKAKAKEVSSLAQALRTDVAQDFRTHRVRLDYAITRKNWPVAQTEVRILLEFLQQHPQHEYVNWLSNLDRRIRVKYGSERKKKK